MGFKNFMAQSYKAIRVCIFLGVPLMDYFLIIYKCLLQLRINTCYKSIGLIEPIITIAVLYNLTDMKHQGNYNYHVYPK